MVFTKMHGLGNDYIYINCFEQEINEPSSLAKCLSDRHFGVGGDGIVLILPSSKCDFKMRMFNQDGSEAEMCGNAIRCVGKFVYDNKMTDKTNVSIETLAGVKNLELFTNNLGKVVDVKVDMGEPILDPKLIPVLSDNNRCIDSTVFVGEKSFDITCVSMGNPHGVIFVDDVDNFPVEEVGMQLENHKIFPNKANIEFVEVLDQNKIKMRVWERGSGETLACGTGACACVVAGVLKGLCSRETKVLLRGGELLINWNEDNHVYMTGSATKVFDGEILNNG